MTGWQVTCGVCGRSWSYLATSLISFHLDVDGPCRGYVEQVHGPGSPHRMDPQVPDYARAGPLIISRRQVVHDTLVGFIAGLIVGILACYQLWGGS